MTFLLAALAVFWAWEFLLMLSPYQIPPVLQPALVVGLGYLATLLTLTWLTPAAIAGVVAILHQFVRSDTSPQAFRLPTRGALRYERARSRIPALPN